MLNPLTRSHRDPVGQPLLAAPALALALTLVSATPGCTLFFDSDPGTPPDTGSDTQADADVSPDVPPEVAPDLVEDAAADLVEDVTADLVPDSADVDDDTASPDADAGDTTPPTVSAAAPEDGTTVAPDGLIVRVTFDEPMDESTITTDSFGLKDSSSGVIVGSVIYDSGALTAAFTPSSTLTDGTYTATVTTGVTDAAGNPLESDFVWSFATDGTAPTVDAVTPIDGAVVRADAVVTASFSEPIDESTLAANFNVSSSGGGSVVGVITYDAPTRTATFTPSADLVGAQDYDVTVSTGITDLVGNPLAAARVWQFTVDDTAPSVVSIDPPDGARVQVDGVVGVTFSEDMDESALTAGLTVEEDAGAGASGTPVGGAVSYSDGGGGGPFVATFTPSGDLSDEVAYRVRVAGSVTDLAGNPLGAEHTWTFTADGSAPTVAGALPADGTTALVSTDIVLTFSEAMSTDALPAALSLDSGAVTFVGYDAGRLEATWSLDADLGDGATVQATLDATSAVDEAGNPMAADFIWSFIGDDTAPEVSGTDPANGTTVGSPSAVTVFFSELMRTDTGGAGDVEDNIELEVLGASVPGAVTYDTGTHIATFDPDSATLGPGDYTLTIFQEVTDFAGNALVADVVATFTVVIPPTVVQSAPAADETAVDPRGATVQVQFTVPMAGDTLTTSTFSLTADPDNLASPVTGTVTYDDSGASLGDNVATFTPTSDLFEETVYEARILATVTHAGGIPVGSSPEDDVVVRFTTGDPTPLAVTATSPLAGQFISTQREAIQITFNDALDPTSVTDTSARLADSGDNLLGTREIIANSVVFWVNPPGLAADEAFTVTITTDVTDNAGNALESELTLAFRTAPDILVTEYLFDDSANEELIEIYNPSAVAVNMTGWHISGNAGRVALDHPTTPGSDISIPAGGSVYGVPNRGTVPIDAAFVWGDADTTFDFEATGEFLRIEDPSPQMSTIVSFNFLNTATDPDALVAPDGFPSMQDVSTQLDLDEVGGSPDVSATRWCTTFRMDHTAGQDNLDCDDVVINEVLYDYAAPGEPGDTSRVFIELAGPGGADLSGWRVVNVDETGTPRGGFTPDHTFIAGERLPSNGIFVLADGDAGALPDPTTLVPNADIVLNNCNPRNGDANGIWLYDGSGSTLVDRVGYGPGAGPVSNGTPLASLAPNDVPLSLSRGPDSDDSQDNATDLLHDPSPTPGLANDVDLGVGVVPLVTDIAPDRLPPSATGSITLTVIDLAPPFDVDFNGTAGTNCDIVALADELPYASYSGPATATCDLMAPLAPGRGDIVLDNRAGFGSDTVTNGWMTTDSINETDSDAELDYCVVQWPLNTTAAAGAVTEALFGQLFEAGITDVGETPEVFRVELGYAPCTGDCLNGGIVDPRFDTAGGWTWQSPAAFNNRQGNNYEYQDTITVPAGAAVDDQFGYLFRVSQDSGTTYTYCDRSGAGSDDLLEFDEPPNPGVLTVIP